MRNSNHLPDTEELALHDAQSICERYHIPVVWCDHQATRRQRLHGANMPGGKNAYTSTHFVEILEHLAQHGFDAAIFICEDPRGLHHACQIEFAPLD